MRAFSPSVEKTREYFLLRVKNIVIYNYEKTKTLHRPTNSQ